MICCSRQSTASMNCADHRRVAERLRAGVPGIDLAQVMVASQKSSVAFQAMTQVRNKLITAYEDIMKMPI